MMYSNLPTTPRRLIKTTLTLAWAFAGGSGFSSVLLAPEGSVRELGEAATSIFGSVLTIAVAFAMFGVAAGRYRWEWIASYLASASLAPYMVLLWASVFFGRLGSMPQSFLVTSLLAFFVLRGFMCAAHAAVLRAAHVAAESLIGQHIEGESDAGGSGRNG